MNLKSPIIALATPSGVGAIAVIRISGESSIDLVDSSFEAVSRKPLVAQGSHTIHLGYILKNKKPIDQVLVSMFKNPCSYTGEDVVEISCHGSHFIQQSIIQHFIEQGCRMATHGEFTLRAFLNGKIDLSQAEAVVDVIASNSQSAHEVAMNQLRGGISNELKQLRKELTDFVSLIELELDFSEEDIDFADMKKFADLVEKLIATLKKLVDSFSFGNAIKNGIPVAILGQPNVGKSTLLNTLLEEEKAIVSDIAGTTRDVIEDEFVIEGIKFRFIDTAGIRETPNSIEQMGIKKAYQKAEQSKIIFYMLDGEQLSKKDNNSQLLMLKKIQKKYSEKTCVVLVNKTDLLSLEENKTLTERLDKEAIFISAKHRSSISILKERLLSFVYKASVGIDDTIVSNSRHYEALTKALTHILEVKKSMNEGISKDLYTYEIRECLRHIGNVTGAFDIDKDILGNIFSNFCIGK